MKLSSVQAAQVSNSIDRAQGTRGLIIDLRNYPSEFVVFALGSLLVDRPTPFARFTSGDLDNPGAFRWTGEPLTLSPQQPHYAGKVVILVDEISQSQAEYTTMAFRSARQAMVVGSTTAGADGNVSQVILPGGLSAMISGIGVFYPDKTTHASALSRTWKCGRRSRASAPVGTRFWKRRYVRFWDARRRPIRSRRWPDPN